MKHAPAWRHRALRAAAAATMVAGFAGIGTAASHTALARGASVVSHQTISNCNLGNGIRHVISIQFDNVHLFRDNQSGNSNSPQYNVPSDLEQMPNLLNFMELNGFVSGNHHTPLIAHTGTDILTTLTGVYPDKFGVPIANSYRVYTAPNGNSDPAATFTYWTDPLYDYVNSTPYDHAYNMLSAAPTPSNPTGTNAPAPWVPYTRAGCDVGEIASANTVIENPKADVPVIFGPSSPQASETSTNPTKAAADFEGLAVHCASTSGLCSGGQNDVLPNEPGGYAGYSGLFGAQSIDQSINGGSGIQDLNGNTIQDSHGNVGFPGFDGMSAAVSLGYVAKMQESGVPITYAYISDAHDQHLSNGSNAAQGPGSPIYEAALHSYDQAFGTFFARLASDGINSSNTLFTFTSDENDHFVGGQPSPSNCNGITISCTSYGYLGELNVNYNGLLNQERGNTTPFSTHADSAPNVYVNGNPTQTDPVVRQLERDSAALTAVNPITGNTDTISNYIADQTAMTAVHMMSLDPLRNPTFTMFAKPDYYLYSGGQNCTGSCLTENPSYAYNHGDFAPDINTTWLGMVGPGIKHLGWVGSHQLNASNPAPWSDHTDIRPTMFALMGLKDSYVDDGRVLTEYMLPASVPIGLRGSPPVVLYMAQIYKQLNAPVGRFGLLALTIGNEAAVSGSSGDDSQYTQYTAALANDTTDRNALTGPMLNALQNAEFNGQHINPYWAVRMVQQGRTLLNQMTNEAFPAP